MGYPETFAGFQVNSPDTWLEFNKNEFQSKPFGDHDVDIKIEACGVCASDIHTISGGWGEQYFPLCVGHGNWSTLNIFISLLTVDRNHWKGPSSRAQGYPCQTRPACWSRC